jgi:phospholipase/carboxylesterase
MRLVKLGELAVRLAGGPDDSGGGDGPLVVLCHGFGAPGDDLVPLGQMFGAPPAVRFAFPAAPLAPPAMGGGRAWWMIDMARLEQAMARGEHRDLRGEEPAGLAEVRGQLAAVIDGLAGGAPVVLGGFSQGAMAACDLARRSALPLAGLVLLSPAYLAAAAWRPAMAARAGLPVFVSHGRQDPLLSFEHAELLAADLAAAGLAVDFAPFDGGHEIPPPVLGRCGGFLRGLVAARRAG